MNATTTLERPAVARALPAPRLPGLALPGPAPVLFKHWLAGHRDSLFRWSIQRIVPVGRRRTFATTAVALQRLRGPDVVDVWLLSVAVQTATAASQPSAHTSDQTGDQTGAQTSGLPEAALAGLAPELRTLLRLVSRGELCAADAMALLAQPLAYVRGRLLQARMRH